MQLVSYHSMSHTLWKTLLYTWEENGSLKDSYLILLVPIGAIAKMHRLGGLKQYKFIILYYQRSEVQSLLGLNQSVRRDSSFWRLEDKPQLLASFSFWRLPTSLGLWPLLHPQSP